MCSQPDYCFLAELTVFPGDEDSLTLHVIASQKQRALLFMFLEFCLSSFGFLNFERGIICFSNIATMLSIKNLSESHYIFFTNVFYLSLAEAVLFLSGCCFFS